MVANHRDGRAGAGAHEARPAARGVAAGLRNHGAGRIDRDATLTITLSIAAIATKIETGEVADTLRLSQTVIDLADGDPTKGNIVFGSPLAMALAMARGADPMSLAFVISFTYGFAIPAGVLLADDAALHDIEEALELTER